MGQPKKLVVALSNDVLLPFPSPLLPSDVLPVTSCNAETLDGTYDELILLATPVEVKTLSDMAKGLSAALKPGGKCCVQQRVQEGASAGEAAKAVEQLTLQLMLAGLLSPAKSTSISDGFVAVEATKPSFQVGAKAAISLKPRTVAAKPVAATWNMALDDDDGDLVDEDDLLTEADEVRPSPATDCGVTSTRKACKDCSCGRAEAEAAGIKPKLTKEMIDNPQSNCGSCGLGDAFRCAGCPYRGLPKFKAGEKIELPADFLSADV